MAASAASTWTSFRRAARANSWRAHATATTRRWPPLPPPPASELQSNVIPTGATPTFAVAQWRDPGTTSTSPRRPPSGASPALLSCLCSGRSSDRLLGFLAGAPGSIYYLGLGVNLSYPPIAPIAIKPPSCHHSYKRKRCQAQFHTRYQQSILRE